MGMVDELQQMLDALSSPIRREILWLLADHELAAGEIASSFDVTAPTISQHLAVLRETGLVEMRIDGNFRRYRARRDRLVGVGQLISGAARWEPATDIPETEHASIGDGLVVVVSVDVEASPELAFDSFVDANRYSRWMGVPVSIVDGRFSCTLEWGTTIRGTYDVVAAPLLIAMRWDFADDDVPVPGGELIAYLRVAAHSTGSTVTVHQLTDDETQAEFMRVAWSMVLGRFAEGIGRDNPPGRARRPKRTATAEP